MRLVKIEKYEVIVDPVIFTLQPFKKLFDRDKTKEKTVVFKEVGFIYHYADLKSDFNIITNENEKIEEIKKRVGLGDKWKIDADVQSAIDLYKERTISPEMDIFLNAMKGAIDTGKYLASADTLLKERDVNGKYITTPQMMSASLKSITQIIKDLKILEMEVIREQQGMIERNKGSQTLGLYEDVDFSS